MDQQRVHPDIESLLTQTGSLRHLARKLLADEHLAEDAAQEALVVALERRSAWRPETVGRWMGRVTRHLALRWREGRAGREAREREVAKPEADSGGGEEFERLEMHRQLVTAVMGLEDPYRSTIVLRFFEGLDPSRIGERQGVSPAAVRKRLSRGLAMLRGRLEDEFGDQTGGWCAAMAWFSKTAPPHGGMRELVEVAWMAKHAVAIGLAAAGVIGVSLWIGLGGVTSDSMPSPGDARPTMGDSVDGLTALAPQITADEERVALEAAIVDGSPLVVSTVDEEGRPLTGVEVLVMEDERLTDRSTTDASGMVSLEGSDGGGTLAARVEGRATVVRTLDTLRGPQCVELPAGRRLAGRLLVDGDVPARPLTLELLSNEDPLDGLPVSIRELLRAEGMLGAERRGELDADGRFAFEGLASDWSGELRLPRARWFVEAPPDGSVKDGGSETLYLRGPAEGMQLRATRMPSVRGRVVWADTGDAVAEAWVWMSFSVGKRGTADSLSSTTVRVAVDGSGRFEHVLALGSPRRWIDVDQRPFGRGYTINVHSEGDFVSRLVAFPDAEHSPDTDLGDIPVERLAGGPFHFLVRDTAGSAIEGAAVKGAGHHAITGPDGRGRIGFLAAGPVELLLGAPGFQARSIRREQSGATRELPARFVLEPGSLLNLLVRDAAGDPISGVQVTLVASEHIFPSTAPWSSVQRLYGGAILSSITRQEGKVHVPLWTDERGEIRLYDLVPGLALQVQVQDELRTHLFEDHLVTPLLGEQVTRSLLLPAVRFSLEAKVRDEAGNPLPNVSVCLGGRVRAESDSRGLYRFEGLFPRSEPVTLQAELAGHVTGLVEGIVLSPSACLPDLVLERGLDLRVLVVGEDGSPVPVKFISASASAAPDFPSEPAGPGRFLIHDLPPRPIRLRTEYGPHTYGIEHEPRQGDFRWVLPHFGSLTVQPPISTPEPEPRAYVELRVTSRSDESVSITAPFPGDGSIGERWSRPLPLEPGPWSAVLVRRWREDGEWREEPLGPSRDVEVRGGEQTRIQLE